MFRLVSQCVGYECRQTKSGGYWVRMFLPRKSAANGSEIAGQVFDVVTWFGQEKPSFLDEILANEHTYICNRSDRFGLVCQVIA